MYCLGSNTNPCCNDLSRISVLTLSIFICSEENTTTSEACFNSSTTTLRYLFSLPV